jgi:hypothetical protein
VRGIVTFADPIARTTADGRIVHPGHTGQLYWALGYHYAGVAARRRLTLLPDGTTFSDRAAQKIRSNDRGHRYAERQLVDLGATPRLSHEDPRRLLPQALDAVGARTLRHPGNYRYTVEVGRRRRRTSAASQRRPPIAATLLPTAS